MFEKMGVFMYAFSTQSASDDILVAKLPSNVGFSVLGVSFVGTNSGANVPTIDVKDDGVAISGFAALNIATVAGDYEAGTTPINIAAGSVISVDLNLTSDNLTGTLAIWGYWDEA